MPNISWIFYFLGLTSVYKALGFTLKRKLLRIFTALDDIPLLGTSRQTGHKIGGTAVICGGSLSGLLAARVCSDHFEKVLIVEPEAWVATEEGTRDRHRQVSSPESLVPKRSRVAQYLCTHIYQAFVILTLRKLFPDFDDQFQRAGARILPSIMHLHVSGVLLLVPYYKYPKGDLPAGLYFTRPGYETTLRRMVLAACSNVKYVTGSVTGLVAHPKKNAVSSVVVRSHSGDGMSTEIPASLVVDCTGPALGGLRWLQDTAFTSSRPKSFEELVPLNHLVTTYDHKSTYTSCNFDVPPELFDKITETVLPRDYEADGNIFTGYSLPPANRTFMISRRDGNYLEIMCGGWDVRKITSSIPLIREHLLEFMPVKPIPSFVFALLDLLEEEEVPMTYTNGRSPPAVYVKYALATKVPSNFIAVGDAVMQVNPVRAVGCTKSCIDAATLNGLLAGYAPSSQKNGEDLPSDFSRKFFASQAKRMEISWESQKVMDYQYPATVPTKGEDPKSYGAFLNWYNKKVFGLATQDREVGSALWHVAEYMASPTDLFAPSIVAKVIWLQLKQTFAGLHSSKLPLI